MHKKHITKSRGVGENVFLDLEFRGAKVPPSFPFVLSVPFGGKLFTLLIRRFSRVFSHKEAHKAQYQEIPFRESDQKDT